VIPPTPPTNDGIEWGNLAQIGSFGVSALAFLVSSVAFFGKRNDEQITGLKTDIKALRDDDARQFERIDKIEADIAGVKADVRHLPTREEVHRIDVRLSEIGARIEARFEALDDKMDTAISQMQRAQDRLAEREDRIK